jgi:hypothetical protein
MSRFDLVNARDLRWERKCSWRMKMTMVCFGSLGYLELFLISIAVACNEETKGVTDGLGNPKDCCGCDGCATVEVLVDGR